MISEAFAKVLQSDRARFNAKFAEARRRRPTLEPEAWAALLRDTVAPIVEAVERVQPDRTAEVAETLYDVALDLLGQELLGSRGAHPAIAAGWEKLLPRLPRFLAAAPHQVAGAVTNALYNLASVPGARPQEWIDALLGVMEVCPDVPTLLRVGQVVAWRAGLAHYRLDALEICTELSVENAAIARAALGLPADSPASLEVILDRLLANPWLAPAAAAESTTPAGAKRLKMVARVGDFRGLGGEFLTPPQVAEADGRLVVKEGDRNWWLTADVFGATLRRAPDGGVRPQKTVPRAWKSALSGGAPQGYPHPQTISSLAANETTLALTSTLSYRVYLLAMIALGDAGAPESDGR